MAAATTSRPPVVFDRLPLEGGYVDGKFRQIYTIAGKGTYEHGGCDLLHRVPGQTFRARVVNPSSKPSRVAAISGAGTDYGNHVILDHPGTDYWSLYAHLDELIVKVNDIVQPGQTIGYVGATGFVTGPHLHWEVCENRQAATFGAIRQTDAEGVGRLISPTLRDPESFLDITHGPTQQDVAYIPTLEDALASLKKTSDVINLSVLPGLQRNYDRDGEVAQSLANLSDRVNGLPAEVVGALVEALAARYDIHVEKAQG